MDLTHTEPLGVAVVGAGYWGPNLVRNFAASGRWDLRWLCDLDRDRAAAVVGRTSPTRVTDDLDLILGDPAVVAVAVATPAATHTAVALRCLEADRHVLVEKPLASSLADGRKLVEVAADRGLILMCDHTYCYTPVVSHIAGLVTDGALGDIQYIDSVRVNLGLVQGDIDVVWDLAPHDLSILDFVLPPDRRPVAVAAHGSDPVGAGHACVAYLVLELGGGACAHLHLNWLSPTKIRTTLLGGSRQMLVWDDLNPAQRLSIYDRGVDLRVADDEGRRQTLVSYRSGAMVAPSLPEREALAGVVTELADAITERRPARTDGAAGLRVLELLECADRSMQAGGRSVTVEEVGN
jgi:predicted dehydrogenase